MGVGPRNILIALAFLAVTGVAVGDGHSAKDAPQNHDYWKDSQCWGCHKPGAWSPDMDPLLRFVPTKVDLTAVDAFSLDVAGYNTWQASNPINELSDWRVGLDISGAPSLSFVSDREPFAASLDGVIAYDPAAPPSGTTAPQTQPHTGHVTFEMPTGATSAVVTILPDDQNPTTGPELSVNIYTGKSAPSGDPDVQLSAAGRGGIVTGTFINQDFADLGYGNWTVEAVTTPIPLDGSTPTPTFADIPFSVQVAAVFDASAETLAVDTARPGVLPGQAALFSWDLQKNGSPGIGEVLIFTTNVTIHYQHEGSEPDWWEFQMDPIEIPIDVGATGATIGSDDISPGGITIVDATPVSLAAISEAVGYASAFLLLASVYTGGMFGKTSRRQLNHLFGTAKRRVAFHNFLSYGIIAAAIAHTILFLIEINYHWALGLIWGGIGVLCLLALGVTGAIQVPMIRRWNYAVWRWSHFYLAIAAIVFTLIHLALDGQNFHFIQEAIGYRDPLVPADRQ